MVNAMVTGLGAERTWWRTAVGIGHHMDAVRKRCYQRCYHRCIYIHKQEIEKQICTDCSDYSLPGIGPYRYVH